MAKKTFDYYEWLKTLKRGDFVKVVDPKNPRMSKKRKPVTGVSDENVFIDDVGSFCRKTGGIAGSRAQFRPFIDPWTTEEEAAWQEELRKKKEDTDLRSLRIEIDRRVAPYSWNREQLDRMKAFLDEMGV